MTTKVFNAIDGYLLKGTLTIHKVWIDPEGQLGKADYDHIATVYKRNGWSVKQYSIYATSLFGLLKTKVDVLLFEEAK